MIRRPPRSTPLYSSAASDVYKRQRLDTIHKVHWKSVHKYNFFFPEIHNGSNSQVHLAEEEGKKLVIKSYNAEWALRNKSLFNSEVHYLSQLSAAGLSPKPIGKIFRSTNNVYFAMECCNCGSLEICVERGKAFSMGMMKEIIKFLASALKRLREMNVVHTEISPRHILANCDEAGNVSYKLAGLRHCRSSNKVEPLLSSYVGTSAYTAPEILSSKSFSFESDI
eukprot:TRINITY_DN1971_c0_g1_i12.p1 TRINITY_DN1971_c0_g1~~TRINITY_DN1971_c0_g1_i12.p1  ORF type:complete len:233 (+),score=49.66 TRINITY_DN1971_c0_g1_i12:28-699(+)